MNPEQSEKEPALDTIELERLKSSVDVIAGKWGAAEREKLKNNLQYLGIGRQYTEIKQRFDENNPNRHYLVLLESLMHDLKDFPD